MNFRLLLCIAMGVFVAHLGVVMLIAHFRSSAQKATLPKPNFSARSTVYVDPASGEKTIYREITVSTKFAPAGTGAGVPAQPAVDHAAGR